MSAFEFKLPDIGEGVTEGEVVAWHVKVGDRVREDDPMVEVMTDKATVTIGAPRAGVIVDMRYAVGSVARVGSVLVVIETGIAGDSVVVSARPEMPPPPTPGPPPSGSAAAMAAAATASTAQAGRGARDAPAEPAAPVKAEPAATAVGDIREGLPGTAFFATRPVGGAKGKGAGGNGGGNGHAAIHGRPDVLMAGVRPPAPKPVPPAPPVVAAPPSSTAHVAPGPVAFYLERPLATPAVRRVARELGVDLRRVRPTGPGGRATRADVETFATQGGSAALDRAAPLASSAPAAPHASRAQVVLARTELEERRPFVGIRRKIAERMQRATTTAAHFTFVEECDVGRLMDFRERLLPAAEARGIKLSFLPFIAKAVVAALKKHPVLNTALDESTNELVYRHYYHLGIATATEQGLMVPVVRDADQRSVLEIAQEIERLSRGAREGKLSPQELTGSTFTITSLGRQGGLFATPVLNFPEVGILGVHQIKERPVVRDGQIVIGNVMLLSLSFDHRIVDGHVGAAFAYDLIAYLEEPGLLMLEMA